jgi:hypothetical protein
MGASVEHGGMGGAASESARPRAAAADVSVDAGTDAAGIDQPSARIEQHEREALEPILRRLVAIERALGLREKIEVPRASRRRPLGA